MAPLRIPHTIGSGAVVGEGDKPELWALYSLDGASEATPDWRDASADVRSFSVSRGRESELEKIDAGTASLVLDNRDRAYDPGYTVGIRPLNRWWLRSQYAGATQDLFKGYAESYTQSWPDPVADQVATVSLVDEFKILNLERLPTMDPPRDSYAEVIAYDNPAGYWKLDDSDPETRRLEAVVGNELYGPVASPWSAGAPGPIVGDNGGGYITLGTASTSCIFGDSPAARGSSGDLTDLRQGTIEAWLSVSAFPAATHAFVYFFTTAAAGHYFELRVTPTGTFEVAAKDAGGTTFTAASGVLQVNTWYHVVGTLGGGNLRLYINGVNVATTGGWTIYFPTFLAPTFMQADGSTTVAKSYDELAVYRYALPAARIAAHYTAGLTRGYSQDRVGVRTGKILDTIGSNAPRSIRSATRNVNPTFMHGQEALAEMQRALECENVDAMLFVGDGGEIVFLDEAHRSVSPWSTAQLTFDDDGTDLPYLSLALDYSEAFLFNEWRVTRDGGLTQTASDATSTDAYFTRAAELSGLPLSDDATALIIATALLAKYKDPLTRIVGIEPNMADRTTAAGVLARELGDRIQILRTPLGGGARINQSPWIQKIEISAGPGEPWRCRLAVSPR